MDEILPAEMMLISKHGIHSQHMRILVMPKINHHIWNSARKIGRCETCWKKKRLMRFSFRPLRKVAAEPCPSFGLGIGHVDTLCVQLCANESADSARCLTLSFEQCLLLQF